MHEHTAWPWAHAFARKLITPVPPPTISHSHISLSSAWPVLQADARPSNGRLTASELLNCFARLNVTKSLEWAERKVAEAAERAQAAERASRLAERAKRASARMGALSRESSFRESGRSLTRAISRSRGCSKNLVASASPPSAKPAEALATPGGPLSRTASNAKLVSSKSSAALVAGGAALRTKLLAAGKYHQVRTITRVRDGLTSPPFGAPTHLAPAPASIAPAGECAGSA